MFDPEVRLLNQEKIQTQQIENLNSFTDELLVLIFKNIIFPTENVLHFSSKNTSVVCKRWHHLTKTVFNEFMKERGLKIAQNLFLNINSSNFYTEEIKKYSKTLFDAYQQQNLSIPDVQILITVLLTLNTSPNPDALKQLDNLLTEGISEDTRMYPMPPNLMKPLSKEAIINLRAQLYFHPESFKIFSENTKEMLIPALYWAPKSNQGWKPLGYGQQRGYAEVHIFSFYIYLFLTHNKPEIAFAYASIITETYLSIIEQHPSKEHKGIEGTWSAVATIYQNIAGFLIQNLGDEQAIKLMSAFVCNRHKEMLANEKFPYLTDSEGEDEEVLPNEACLSSANSEEELVFSNEEYPSSANSEEEERLLDEDFSKMTASEQDATNWIKSEYERFGTFYLDMRENLWKKI